LSATACIEIVLASENAISTRAEQRLDKPGKTRHPRPRIDAGNRPAEPAETVTNEGVGTARRTASPRARPLPARAALAPQARSNQPDHDAAEEHAGAGEEPILPTVARELGVLHDETVDALLGLGGAPLELLILVANRDHVRGRGADIGKLLRGLVAFRRRAFELGSGPSELFGQARDLGLELADAGPGLLEITLGGAEPLPRNRLRLQIPR